MRFAILLLGLVVLPALARAGEPADAFAAFSSGDYDAMAQAVGVLATSADPHATAVITALRDGRLFATEAGDLLIRNPDGTFTNAQTGAPVSADEDDLKKIRMNNAVRRAVDTAEGGMQLFAADPSQRRAAAQALFTSHDPATLPALSRALAKEPDPSVRVAMAQAQAAALLMSADAPEAAKLQAVAVIRARGDLEASALLASIPSPTPAVAGAAHNGVIAIQRVLQLWDVLESVFYGLSLGSVLLLAAIGLAITFGVMGVINMAHGEMVMIGAYVTFVVQAVIRANMPSLFGASVVIAVPLAFLVAGALGIAIERTLIRFLYGRPLETLLATWGLSLVLQQAVRSLFGPTNREVGTPSWMSGAVPLGGLTITLNRLTIIIFAFAVFTALMALLRYTSLGLKMRAVTQNRAMAAAMGIRTPWIDALTFGLGSGVAGMAGVALTQIDNVSPNLGQGYIIDSFMVVVFGGVGNLWGTALGALLLGIVNKFLEPFAGAVLGKIAVLVLVILFIQRRPRGLFPLKGRAAEA